MHAMFVHNVHIHTKWYIKIKDATEKKKKTRDTQSEKNTIVDMARFSYYENTSSPSTTFTVIRVLRCLKLVQSLDINFESCDGAAFFCFFFVSILFGSVRWCSSICAIYII